MSKLHEEERRSLLNLCLGVLGRHLQDITDQLHAIAPFLPPSIKMTLLAMARRKNLINDEVLAALVDESWEILDVSGANVTDLGLEKASKMCSFLKAVDISGCNNLTSSSIQALVQNCPLMETLRCGGTGSSNAAAKQSIHFIVPRLNFEVEAEESWESLESKQVGKGASALRWLVWPAIDEVSHKQLLMECPKVVINPAAFASHKSRKVPREAFPDIALDCSAVVGIDPHIWSAKLCTEKVSSTSSLDTNIRQLSIAERFKLAFDERDERLASKRAKNLRQNQRRAEKAWIGSDSSAKAVFWAGLAHKSMKK